MPGELHPSGSGPTRLTRRELEVVRLVSEGLSGPEVAKRICRSPRTIEKHLASAYHKLGVRNRVELVHRAQEHGLLHTRLPTMPTMPSMPSVLGGDDIRGRAFARLQAIDDRLASFVNHAYFAEFALAIADAFAVRWAGFSEAAPQGDQIEIIAFVADGKLVEQMSCSRTASPCSDVLARGEHLVTDNFAAIYPASAATAACPGVRSYAGVRLDDRILGTVGALWIMDDKPIDPAAEPLLVLRLLSRRAAPELALARTLDGISADATARIDPNLN